MRLRLSSKELRQKHIHSPAEAGYDIIKMLEAATLEDLEEAGLTMAKNSTDLKPAP